MTLRARDTEIQQMTVAQRRNIVFDSFRAPCTFVAVEYRDGWQCYQAYGLLEAETALRLGTLLPVHAARIVFPMHKARPYYYSDRREKQIEPQRHRGK
jgi:hypothetical protein